MFFEFLIKGVIVGIIFGIPAGALGALVISRTLDHGYFSGLLTGLGSSLSNTIYAALCIWGSGLVDKILAQYEKPITIIGGFVIVLLGVWTFKKQSNQVQDHQANQYFAHFSSGFMIATMNPGMILLFLFACSLLQITGPYQAIQSYPLLMGTFIGTFIWWLIICGVINKMRHKMTDKVYQQLNNILAILLVLFGLAVIIKAIN